MLTNNYKNKSDSKFNIKHNINGIKFTQCKRKHQQHQFEISSKLWQNNLPAYLIHPN